MKSVGEILTFSILKTITAIVFSIAILHPNRSTAQWREEFADGDFHSDPSWEGDVNSFTVVDQRLALNAGADSETAFLATPSTTSFGVWEFQVTLDFNPSGSNLLRVFLCADQPNPNDPLQGYFVLVGGSTDEISLYRQTGQTRTRIIDGPDGRTNLSKVSATIRVVRSSDGSWDLSSRLENETTFRQEGVAVDNLIGESAWFGIQCVFTSTRRDRFSFDDISVEPRAPNDTTAPAVLNVSAVEANRLDVVFSEPIPHDVLTDTRIYHVGDRGHPEVAESLSGNRGASLSFSNPFENGVAYKLSVGPVRDAAGNETPSKDFEFRFVETVAVNWKDVVVSEVFFDPTPVIGLPEAEFVEIYNRSSNAVSLGSWTLSDLSSFTSLEDRVLFPGEYLILTSHAAASLYETFGSTHIVSRFPSLNNGGDAIVLKNERGIVIDSLHYDASWYRDEDKNSGGWSIELIDPNNVCAEGENWTASESADGGTPGSTNSVYAEKFDLKGPELSLVYAEAPDQLRLIFNEKLENRIPETVSFRLTPDIVIKTISLSSSLRELTLALLTPLIPSTIYSLEVSGIYDCPGNIIGEGTRATFALPEPPDSLDVVINEILFNPRPGGADFVEIANRSKKFLDLREWQIGQWQENHCVNRKSIASTPVVLRPDSILALTSNVENILNEYPRSINLMEAILPAYNDDAGGVCITDSEGKILDAFRYDSRMHSPFLQNAEGVSLERLSTEAATNDPSNWKSASGLAGFATPGYENSNRVMSNTDDAVIRVEPEIFIAEVGQPSFATIHYAVDQADQMANITILDNRGRRIRTVARNALLGSAGFFRWDGERDDGGKARTGSYMIRIELFDRTGVTRVIHKRVAIAGRF